MLGLFTVPNNPLAKSLTKDKSVADTFIPFQIDSTSNVQIAEAFLNETQLTRYRCTGCKKHIIWVGECGKMNHNLTIQKYEEVHKTKPLCPICHSVIGHTGYNKPFNLERLDKVPIKKTALGDTFRLVDPGYQASRPAFKENVRGIGGMNLRLGRFLILSQIYCYGVYVLERQKLEENIGLTEA